MKRKRQLRKMDVNNNFINKEQWVNVHPVISDYYTPTSGIFQCTFFFPLLIALFVNLATSVFQHFKLLIFLNDMKIFLQFDLYLTDDYSKSQRL